MFIANSQQLAERLLAFELDLALIEGEVTHPQLHSEAWQQDQMLLVTSPMHPLAQRTAASDAVLSAADLAGQYWVLREAQSGSREQFDKYLRPQLSAQYWHSVGTQYVRSGAEYRATRPWSDTGV